MDKSSVFRQESLDRVASPEQLDNYIKVARPGIWIALGAFLILMVSVIVWGVMGTLPETLTVSGLLNEDRTAVCFVGVTALENDITGCKAKITTVDGNSFNGVVSAWDNTPYSSEEIAKMLAHDWYVEKLVTENYAHEVSITITDEDPYIPGTIASVTLITAEVKPISFILN